MSNAYQPITTRAMDNPAGRCGNDRPDRNPRRQATPMLHFRLEVALKTAEIHITQAIRKGAAIDGPRLLVRKSEGQDMHVLPTLLAISAVLLTSPTGQSAALEPAGSGSTPALGDECATPAQWNPPFTRVYTFRNGGTLVFVAVSHTRAITSATFTEMRSAFDRYKPTMVLVEGASATKSADPAYLGFLSNRAATQFAAGAVGENLYAVKLAAEQGIAYSGWDFSPDQEYGLATRNGFDIKDVIGAHLLRARIDPFESGHQRSIDTEIGYAARIGKVDPFDYGEWYRQNYGTVFDASRGTPCGTAIANRIMHYESVQRSGNAIALIDRYVKPGAIVMIEAGAGHWLAMKEYLASISRSVDLAAPTGR